MLRWMKTHREGKERGVLTSCKDERRRGLVQPSDKEWWRQRVELGGVMLGVRGRGEESKNEHGSDSFL
jgi:hypothetical protein